MSTARVGKPQPDVTGPRLTKIRRLMEKEKLDIYIVPGGDEHNSSCIAPCDRRRDWLSGFTGEQGDAIITKTSAYLLVTSRYWNVARSQRDHNWTCVMVGSSDGPQDWIEWLGDFTPEGARVGLDIRLITYEAGSALKDVLAEREAKLCALPQNLVDLVWKEKPARSLLPVSVKSDTTGKSPRKCAADRLMRVKESLWKEVSSMPREITSGVSQADIGALYSSLTHIANLLSLQGFDYPSDDVFPCYLYLGFTQIILFVEHVKVTSKVAEHLRSIGVETMDLRDVWTFLGRVKGRVMINGHISFAVGCMLTPSRTIVVSAPE